MSCDVCKVMEGLENKLCSFSNLFVTSPTSQLILHPFPRFTYVTAHSPTLPLLHLRYSSFSNSSFASPTSQTLHLIHLASSPCYNPQLRNNHLINFFHSLISLQKEEEVKDEAIPKYIIKAPVDLRSKFLLEMEQKEVQKKEDSIKQQQEEERLAIEVSLRSTNLCGRSYVKIFSANEANEFVLNTLLRRQKTNS